MTNQVQVSVLPAEEAVVEITDAAITSVVEVNSPVLRQPAAQVRIDGSSTNEIYVGLAQYNVEKSSAGWTITRSTYSPAGLRTSKGTAVNVTWTGRAGHTYI